MQNNCYTQSFVNNDKMFVMPEWLLSPKNYRYTKR